MTPAELRARRNRLGLTQEQLARRISVTVSTVARWEQGRMGIRHPEMLAAMLDRLTRTERFQPATDAASQVVLEITDD